MNRLFLLGQLASTLPMVGVIWLVQIVSYPLFGRVGPQEFVAYHAAHARLITVVVGPLMVIELLCSLGWLMGESDVVPRRLAVAGALLTLVTWIATATLSVPAHNTLALGFDARVARSLVTTNWVRTAAWSLRGAGLLWVVAHRWAG